MKKYTYILLIFVFAFLLSGCSDIKDSEQQSQQTQGAKTISERSWNLSEPKIELPIDKDAAIKKADYFIPAKINIENNNKITDKEVEQAYGKKYMNYTVRLSAKLSGITLNDINKDKTRFFQSFGSSENRIEDSIIFYDFDGIFKKEQKYFTFNSQDNRIYLTFAPFVLTSYQGETERKIKLRVYLNDGSQKEIDFFLPKI